MAETLTLAESAERDRIRLAERSRKAFEAAAEIGDLPAVVNKERRAACELDLHRFLVEYFPNSTGLAPFGPKQVAAIKQIEQAVLHGGRMLSLIPRGYAKSSISERACLWATLYGHRQFVLFLGANDESGTEGIRTIKRELENNERLIDDFPEVCVPIAKLQGKFQRCNSQMYKGKPTAIQWTADAIAFATIAGSKSSGAVIKSGGLLAATRGARHLRGDGTQARPDFCIIDDPQTDQSALSPTETAKRLWIIKHSILRLGAHGKQISVVMNATMIAPGDLVDQLSDHKRYPGWRVIRAATVEQMPVAIDSLWLKGYAELLRGADPNDPDGQRKALVKATEFYQANREEMDAGASVSWEHVQLEEGEISALQHAMNILIIEGEEVFDAECQNKPAERGISSAIQITESVRQRKNGYERDAVPEDSQFAVFHIDVHDEILYWSRACVTQDFSGSVVSYGTWPSQPTDYFAHSKVKRKLSDVYAGTTVELAIRNGLVDLLKAITQFGMPISCGLIDAGYKPEIVAEAIRLAEAKNVYSSRGIGIGPTEKPMTEYDTSARRVFRAGPDPRKPRWYFPREQFGRVHFDANFWKDFAAARLTQVSGAGTWKLYGSDRVDHSLYCDQLLSERPVAMTAKGRTCNVWKVVSHRDNHYWDTFVGCNVAASIAGCHLDGVPVAKPIVRRKPRRGGGVSYLD